MGEMETRHLAEQMWMSLEANDWDGLIALYGEGAELVWPQTGEVIRGKDNCLSVLTNYPGGMPTGTLRRIQASGDLATVELTVNYPDGSTWLQCTVLEVRDGKIAKETDYWAPEMEAPEWRAQWVQRT